MSNVRTRRFCFTVNNPTEETTPVYSETTIRFLIYGREVAPTTGTPHLQGYVEFIHPQRINSVKSLPGFQGAHLVVANGTAAQNIEYVSKSDSQPTRFGTPGPGSGTRTDLLLATKSLVDDPSSKGLRDLAASHPDMYVKYHRGFSALVDILAPTIPPISIDPRPWQRNLEFILRGVPDPRKIIFYIDPVGNAGKSFFIRYWYSHFPHDTQTFVRGAQKQMLYNWDGHKYVFFDLTRSEDPEHQQMPYLAMETIKNGYRPTTMYGKRTAYYDVPHVVVMTNEPPDESKLSRDRFQKFILSSARQAY